jgi:hypothetical protein
VQSILLRPRAQQLESDISLAAKIDMRLSDDRFLGLGSNSSNPTVNNSKEAKHVSEA